MELSGDFFFYPADKLVELEMAASTARAAGAERLTLVAPYLCYMRQDKAFHPGEAVSQRIIGDLLARRAYFSHQWQLRTGSYLLFAGVLVFLGSLKYISSLRASLPDLARPPLPPGVQAGGHGGSHGYLMDNFVTSVLADRKPLVDVAQALNMTVSGIVAHQSALREGQALPIPDFGAPPPEWPLLDVRPTVGYLPT